LDTLPRHPVLEPFFRRIVGLRWVFVAVYALLLPPALWAVFSIPQDSAIERMVVRSDPDFVATRAFQQLFPEPQRAVLVLEAPDPFAPPAIAALQRLEAALAPLHRVQAVSALTVFRRLDPAAADGPGAGEALRRFVSGTGFFRRQGLVGDGFLGVMLALEVGGPDERDGALDAVDRALAQAGLAPAAAGSGITAVRRVGGPFVDAWLERETARSSLRYFPLFGLFVVALVYGLYRSLRALAAILLTLAVAVLLGVAAGALLGYGFTIISSLVPLTLMVTATASLVYLHSRYVDHPPGVPMERHQVFALANKFLAVTVSVFAAAVGFAALVISQIRPVRELGAWTALGLAVGWAVCFTLFPALQRILRAPGQVERRVAGGWVEAAARRIPRWSYRWRYALVGASVLLMLLGAGALFGVPGLLAPMPLQVVGLDYVDRDLPIYRDTRWFGDNVLGLSQVSAWITTPPGAVLEPATLAALDRFARALAEEREVGTTTGLTDILQLRRYAAGEGEDFPQDPEAQAALAADLEQLLLAEPALRGYVDVNTLGATYLTVVARRGAAPAEDALPAAVERAWTRVAGDPGLAGASLRVVGQGLLEARIAGHLVPTLVESFFLTAAIIFATFFVVFRSGAARLMAMIPSLFAILTMFLVMRLTGIPLNVATILIATTVLGASENDQVHFFYHFQEGRSGASTEQALAHALRVAGRAIFFATLINAGGFLALTLSDLPPMRQFGIVTASAFLLSMLADFTALPAALWIFFRARPDGAEGEAP
jgi:hypothetical protein